MLQCFTLESSLLTFLFINNNVELFKEMCIGRIAHFETYIQMVRKQIISKLDQCLIHCSRDNISSQETKALSTLRSTTDIVIKPLDKGSDTIVMFSEDYVTKVMCHLNNDQFYEKLPKKRSVSSRHFSK